MTRFSTSLIFALTLALAACGPKLPPDTSTEAKFAVRGNQVVQALRASLPGIKALVCLPSSPTKVCIPPADADKVVAGIEKAGEGAQQLAVVLQGVDTAKTSGERQFGMQKAITILQSIQESVSRAQVAPGTEDARQAVVSALQGVTAALFAVLAF